MYVEMVTMTIRPENVDEFLAGRPGALAAIQERFPDLRAATLVRLDETTWVDWAEWGSLEQATHAAEVAASIEPVAAWFSVIDSVESMAHGTVEHRHTSPHRAAGSHSA
jgi:hypothetical protein